MSILIDCLDGLTMRDILRVTAKTGNGQPFYILTSGLEAFCAEYQRIYDDLSGIGTPPSDAIAAAQNTMVCGLVDDGVWAKLDVFYLYAQTTNAGGEALMNWIATGLFNAVAFNAPAFVPLEGFTGGTNEYINWNWIPSVNGVNYTNNLASYGFYSRINVDENSIDIGANGTSDLLIITKNGGNATIRINAIGSAVGANADTRGLFIINKFNAATENDLFRNKVNIINGVIANSGTPDVTVYSLAQNNAGVAANFSTRQLSMAFGGGGLTQTDIDNLTDRFEIYMDSNGKGVIP